jgi:hypothetical protein
MLLFKYAICFSDRPRHPWDYTPFCSGDIHRPRRHTFATDCEILYVRNHCKWITGHRLFLVLRRWDGRHASMPRQFPTNLVSSFHILHYISAHHGAFPHHLHGFISPILSRLFHVFGIDNCTILIMVCEGGVNIGSVFRLQTSPPDDEIDEMKHFHEYHDNTEYHDCQGCYPSRYQSFG